MEKPEPRPTQPLPFTTKSKPALRDAFWTTWKRHFTAYNATPKPTVK